MQYFCMLASDMLFRDDAELTESLSLMRQNVSSLDSDYGVLGVGAAAGSMHSAAEPRPAVLIEWPFPTMLLFDTHDPYQPFSLNGDRYTVHEYRPMGFWVGDHLRPVADAIAQVGSALVVAVPRAVEQVRPGDRAHCGGTRGPGTFGAPVQLASSDCVLTAGHVLPVPPAGGAIYDTNGTLVGSALIRMCCNYDVDGAPVQPNSDVPDVAVVEVETRSGLRQSLRQGVAEIRGVVEATGAVTSGRKAEISILAKAFAGPGSANWGEAMLTSYPISAPGDSGAMVTNASGEIVGQIVGGYPGVFSVVQDIDYLLTATGTTLQKPAGDSEW
jgi:hypothetical protein